MIPKRIISIWIGDEPTPKVKRCMASWKTVLPDYEFVILGNEFLSKCKLPKLIEKYIARKNWAYVSDYLRLKALKRYPGIYLDSDIFMVKPFTREMLESPFFAGIESEGLVATGVLGSDGSPESQLIIDKLIEFYETSTTMDASPKIMTPVLESIYSDEVKSQSYKFNEYIKFSDGCTIYPREYFYPIHWTKGKLNKYKPVLSDNTICIHEWTGTALGADHFTESFESNYRNLISNFLTEVNNS